MRCVEVSFSAKADFSRNRPDSAPHSARASGEVQATVSRSARAWLVANWQTAQRDSSAFSKTQGSRLISPRADR